MRIYFRTNDSYRTSTDVYAPNGKLVTGYGAWIDSGGVQIKLANCYINGTSITRKASGILYAGSYNNNNNMYIYRVEAWNG